jgi:tRNA (guanosine-2'-O-)-methyltransferase
VKRATPQSFEPGVAASASPWPPGWTPAGVQEVLEPLSSPARRERLRSVLADRLDSITVLLDAPHDPHNGSALMRSCDAFGVQTLHAIPRVEPFLASRTVSKGTERWVEIHEHRSAGAAIAHFRAAGVELVATHPEGELLPEELPHIPRLALVLGNEHEGIGEELLAAASRRVRVPMRGFVESLNLSVAAGILLAGATRGRPGDLSAERRAYLYARGLAFSVPRSAAILEALTPR